MVDTLTGERRGRGPELESGEVGPEIFRLRTMERPADRGVGDVWSDMLKRSVLELEIEECFLTRRLGDDDVRQRQG
jgi:hypothetical protein